MYETILGLLATAGEATILMALMRVGLIGEVMGPRPLPVPSIRSDPVHVAVIALGDMPQRIVFDADFGWCWYNADGPADEGVSP